MLIQKANFSWSSRARALSATVIASSLLTACVSGGHYHYDGDNGHQYHHPNHSEHSNRVSNHYGHGEQKASIRCAQRVQVTTHCQPSFNADHYADENVKEEIKEDVVEEYLISPGDSVEITYHVDVRKQAVYLIAIGDQIRVEFLYYPQLDRTLNVRPDGKVTLPNIGDIDASGLTPEKLAEHITLAYSHQLQAPTTTVSLIRYGERIRELKDAITTSQNGQSRILIVQPDGKVSIPLISTVKVAGKTIDETESLINFKYADVIPGMVTTTALKKITGNKVYIYGEVSNGGYYSLQGRRTTVVQALALAGGLTRDAAIGNVIVISRDKQNRPSGRIVNVKSILRNEGRGDDIALRQADVIFVPKTGLAKASVIGDAIRKMIPINFSAVYNLNSQNR